MATVNFDEEIFRKDNPASALILRNRHLASIVPVSLVYDEDGYLSGVTLARNTTSGKWAKYDGGGSSGLDTAVGVLLDPVPVEDFKSESDIVFARMIVGGELDNALISGMDSNGRTDLDAKLVVSGTGKTIFKF
jgi:hypothetical protein